MHMVGKGKPIFLIRNQNVNKGILPLLWRALGFGSLVPTIIRAIAGKSGIYMQTGSFTRQYRRVPFVLKEENIHKRIKVYRKNNNIALL